jgi:hypothetical protein
MSLFRKVLSLTEVHYSLLRVVLFRVICLNASRLFYRILRGGSERLVRMVNNCSLSISGTNPRHKV